MSCTLRARSEERGRGSCERRLRQTLIWPLSISFLVVKTFFPGTHLAAQSRPFTLQVVPASQLIQPSPGESLHFRAFRVTVGGKGPRLQVASWSSSDPTLATIDPVTGVLTANNSGLTGTVTITATSGPFRGSTPLTISYASVTDISVLPASIAVPKGIPVPFTATGIYSDASMHDVTTQVTWTSSDMSAATVSNAFGSEGMASTVGQGSTTITATLGLVSGSSQLAVLPPALLSLTIAPIDPAILKGANQQLTASSHYTDGSEQDVSSQAAWSSSNANVVAVSPSGLVTGNSQLTGSSTVTAALSGFSASTNVEVTDLPTRFVYTFNLGDQTISGFSVDKARQQLRHIGYWYISSSSSFQIQAATTTPDTRFLYVAVNPGKIYSFSIDQNNGNLTPLGAPTAAGHSPTALKTDATGRFLYVADFTAPQLLGFSIDPITGQLAPLPGSPFPAGTVFDNPSDVVVDPNGRFVFVMVPPCEGFCLGEPGAIFIYRIDQTTGSLTEVPGSPFVPQALDPFQLDIDPAGRFVYSVGDPYVSAYSINPGTGLLTEVADAYTPASYPEGLRASPTGDQLFVSFIVYEQPGVTPVPHVFTFRVDRNNGNLVKTQDVRINALAMAIDPSGEFAYFAGSNDQQRFGQHTPVYICSIAQLDGTLQCSPPTETWLGDTPAVVVAKGTKPVTYAPQFAYIAANNPDAILGFNADASSGKLTQSAAFALPSPPTALAVAPIQSRLFSASDASGIVASYAVNAADGSLTQLSSALAGQNPGSVAIDPSGRFLNVANRGSNDISGYVVDSGSGTLTPSFQAALPSGSHPSAIIFDVTGQFLYVADPSLNEISGFRVDPGTGALTETYQSPFPAPVQPSALAVEQSGQYLYAASQMNNQVFGYSIEPSLGTLTQLPQPLPTGSQPVSMVVDPTGRFLYLANRDSNNVSAYIISPLDGTLSWMLGSPFTSCTSPESLATDPSGAYLYVACGSSLAVSEYSIDPASGVLTPLQLQTFPSNNDPKSIALTGVFQ